MASGEHVFAESEWYLLWSCTICDNILHTEGWPSRALWQGCWACGAPYSAIQGKLVLATPPGCRRPLPLLGELPPYRLCPIEYQPLQLKIPRPPSYPPHPRTMLLPKAVPHQEGDSQSYPLHPTLMSLPKAILVSRARAEEIAKATLPKRD